MLGERDAAVVRLVDARLREMDTRRMALSSPLSNAPLVDEVMSPDAPRLLTGWRAVYPRGFHLAAHRHSHAQFLFAIQGTMSVRTPRATWVVPPNRALWIPANTAHHIDMHGAVEMRTVYVRQNAELGMPAQPTYLHVNPLMRALLVRATEAHEVGDDDLLHGLLLSEMRRLERSALGLPLPQDAQLLRLCEQVWGELDASPASGDAARSLRISTRTLNRRFQREMGVSFVSWRQQARLLEAIRRLAAGQSVISVALDLGYDSPGAFATMFRRKLGEPPSAYLKKP